MIKVLIADDQELIRQSLQIVLSIKEGISVIGTAENGKKVMEFLKKEKPDVILMDIRSRRWMAYSVQKQSKRDIRRLKSLF